MSATERPLILEIIKEEQGLAMSLYEEAPAASTVRTYTRVPVDLSAIGALYAGLSCLKTAPQLKKQGQVLWDHLLSAAVKNRMKNSAACALVLLLDEDLSGIPWELLHDGTEFICLKFSMGRLLRTHKQPEGVHHRVLGSNLRMLILANPTGDLACAYREGLHINDQMSRAGGRLKVDFKSTSIDALYVKKNIRDYDIVHFAGHCEGGPAGADTAGWVLRDGRFTSRDIIAMGHGGGLPALVFANSCHSACACGITTYDMASAFLFAGVRHYIGTIFRVEDETSRIFAKEFYRCLVKGQAAGECVRKARLALARHPVPDPLGWASYVLYGDPSFSLLGAKAVRFGRRRVAFACASALALIAAGAFFAGGAPTVNPKAYLLFAESRRLLRHGKNELAVARAAAALRRDPLLLTAYPVLADGYEHQGDYRAAIQTYYRYALASQKKQDAYSQADAYAGLGWVYQRQGAYPKALDFYEKAVSLSRQHRDDLHEAVALRRLAVWHIDMQSYDKALELLTKSSELNRRHERDSRFRYNLACDYFDLGLVFSDKDDFSAARQFYQKSRQLFGQLTAELADYYFNLGEICLFEKQYQKALAYYAQGLRIDQEHADMPAVAGDHLMIGELYMEMGDLDKAEASLVQALALSKSMDTPLERGASAYDLGTVYARRQQREKARGFFEEALAIYRDVGTPEYGQVQEALAQLAQQEAQAVDPGGGPSE